MNPGFNQTKLLVLFDIQNGNFMWPQEYLFFFSAKYGLLRTKTPTDGISDPEVLQFALQKFGKYVASGIIHDGSFKDLLEQQQGDGAWKPLILNKDGECNELIDECLKSQGCPWIERELIYDALQLFGWQAFDSDRKTPPSAVK